MFGDDGRQIYRVELTGDEIDSAITQLGARIDEFKARVISEGRYERIVELVSSIALIESAQNKLMEVRYGLKSTMGGAGNKVNPGNV